jgi:hypothetical protein
MSAAAARDSTVVTTIHTGAAQFVTHCTNPGSGVYAGAILVSARRLPRWTIYRTLSGLKTTGKTCFNTVQAVNTMTDDIPAQPNNFEYPSN